jgi:hypothetical protein
MLSLKAAELLAKLENAGVTLSVDGEQLLFSAPPGVLFDVNELRTHKAELLPVIRDRCKPPILDEMPDVEFDENLLLWTRGGFIMPTSGTLPAYRKYYRLGERLRRQAA